MFVSELQNGMDTIMETNQFTVPKSNLTFLVFGVLVKHVCTMDWNPLSKTTNAFASMCMTTGTALATQEVSSSTLNGNLILID